MAGQGTAWRGMAGKALIRLIAVSDHTQTNEEALENGT